MDFNRLNLLLIEDNPGDARLIKEMLSQSSGTNYRIEHADRLAAGMELLESKEYDALVLDLNLPDSGAFDTIARVSVHFDRLPVIVLTGMGDEEIALKAIKDGAQDYLPKSELHDKTLVRSIKYSIERKKAREALKESEERYRTIVETSGEGIWVLDQKNTVTFVNQKQAEMLGYCVDEFIGKPVLNFLNEDSIEIGKESFKNLMKGMKATAEIKLNHKDGRQIWGSATATPLKDRMGNYSGSLGILRDITERKKTEVRNSARYNLLNRLRSAVLIDDCLDLGCRAIHEAELFHRAVFTLHDSQSQVAKVGQIGLDSSEVAAARVSMAPDENLVRQIVNTSHRIGNSYFIPRELGLSVTHTSLFVAPEGQANLLPYEIGDALFIPVEKRDGIEGWLAISVPEGSGKPSLDIVMFLEDVLNVVMQRVWEIRHEAELQEERDALHSKNTALREVLSSIESEKLNIRKEIANTINDKLMPAFKKLLKQDGSVNKSYYGLIEDILRELSESVGSTLPISTKLSPRELEICSLIKTGASSKDIADSLDVALVTVQKHREVIRKKLGLTNRSVNLTSYLRNLQSAQ